MNFLKLIKKSISRSEYLIHETKRSVLIRFIFLLIILISYFISVYLKYGLSQGLYVTFLTWSFFVFCTPIADAGFLLDFPIRLITKLRMIYSEILVWAIAFFINIFTIIFNPHVYEKTFLLTVLHKILINPFPYWAIIIISGLGTFLSIYFADELIDVIKYRHRKKHKKHKNKYRIIIGMFIVVVIILIYNYFLKKLGILF